MNSKAWTSLLSFCLVLLMVPGLLTACAGRKVLDSGGPKESKKNVQGKMITSSAPPPTNGSPSVPVSKENTATVWFTRAVGDKLEYVAQERECPIQFKNVSHAVSFAVSQLLEGPDKDGQDPPLSSEVPDGVELFKVTDDKTNGDITVDLSHRFIGGGGNDSFEARLEQVKRTIGSVSGGHRVYLNINGERLTASSDGLEVKQPICGELDSN